MKTEKNNQRQALSEGKWQSPWLLAVNLHKACQSRARALTGQPYKPIGFKPLTNTNSNFESYVPTELNRVE